MKCDICINKRGYAFGLDEYSAGNYMEYCGQGHWDDFGPSSKEEEEFFKSSDDPWKACDDFIELTPNKAE